jgi:hypothetical protein
MFNNIPYVEIGQFSGELVVGTWQDVAPRAQPWLARERLKGQITKK